MKKLSTVNFPEKFTVSDYDLVKLKPVQRAVYSLWQQGYSIPETFSRAQAYRYRKMFMQEFGVDIFQSFPVDLRKTALVLPLLRPLVAEPCEVPLEAIELQLLAA